MEELCSPLRSQGWVGAWQWIQRGSILDPAGLDEQGSILDSAVLDPYSIMNLAGFNHRSSRVRWQIQQALITNPAGFNHRSSRVQSQIQQAFITDPAGFYHRSSRVQSQIQQGLITDPAGFNHRSSRVHSQTSRVMSPTQQGYITDPGGLDHRSSRVQSDPAGFNHKSRRLNPMTWLSAVHHTTTRPGVGVTKSIFSVPLFSYFFSIAKLHVSYWVSHSYLICVTAAQLRWHMSNMNAIQRI